MNNTDNTTEHDAERFLTALQEKVQELLVLSKIPAADPETLSFVDYTKFREKTDECLSFLVIIEGRISEVEGERKELLSEQFDKLVTATWSVLMEGSISFLSVLSEREFLPVGTRHVFEQELKTLSEAEEVMKENKNEKFLASNMTEKRAKARQILNVVIEKAPELLDVREDHGKESLPLSDLNQISESPEENIDNLDTTLVADQELQAKSEIVENVSVDEQTSNQAETLPGNEIDGPANIEPDSSSEDAQLDPGTSVNSSSETEQEMPVVNSSSEPLESDINAELDKVAEGQLEQESSAEKSGTEEGSNNDEEIS